MVIVISLGSCFRTVCVCVYLQTKVGVTADYFKSSWCKDCVGEHLQLHKNDVGVLSTEADYTRVEYKQLPIDGLQI